MLWKLLSSSRIAEDIQLKVCKSFTARGEKELKMGLAKVPWHCYMPTGEDHSKFALPKIDCKTHQSAIYHSKLARNLLMSHVAELPIQREFRSQARVGKAHMNFAEFKKKWLSDHG